MTVQELVNTEPTTTSAIAFSGNSRLVAIGTDARWLNIHIWHVQTGQILTRLYGPEYGPNCLEFSKDGRYFLIGGLYSGQPGIGIWALEAGAEPRYLRGINMDGMGFLSAVKVSPDSQKVVSACQDGDVMVWSIETGRALLSFQGRTTAEREADEYDYVYDEQGKYCVAWSPDSRLVACGGFDTLIFLWDAVTGVQVAAPLSGHEDCVTCVAFDAKTTFLVSGSADETIIIWSLQMGGSAAITRRLHGHIDKVKSVCLSPDDRYIISSSYDGAFWLWSVNGGTVSRVFLCPFAFSATWSSDGECIVMAMERSTLICRMDVQVFVCVCVSICNACILCVYVCLCVCVCGDKHMKCRHMCLEKHV
jgi:WD40 repeat protein